MKFISICFIVSLFLSQLCTLVHCLCANIFVYICLLSKSRVKCLVRKLFNVVKNFPRYDLLTANVSYHIEISQMICIANQLTGFYVKINIGR